MVYYMISIYVLTLTRMCVCVCEYSVQLLRMCCLYMEFADAIREGDGGRVLRCWKYMLPIFLAPQNASTISFPYSIGKFQKFSTVQ